MSTAPSNISKFEVNTVNAQKTASLYKEIDLAHLFEAFPNMESFKMLDPDMHKIISTSRRNLIGEDGTLLRVFEDRAVIRDWHEDSIIWRLHSDENDMRCTVTHNYHKGDDAAGLGDSLIYIGLDTDALGPNDTIWFEDFRTMQFIIQTEPIPDGSGIWKYGLSIVDKDVAYIEDFYGKVPEGKQVILGPSPIPEATTHRGNVIMPYGNAYIEFEAPMTRAGYSTKITDKAWQAAKHFIINAHSDDAKNELEKKFGDKDMKILGTDLEMAFMTETNRAMDYHLTYGRANGQFVGKHIDIYNHKPLTLGPGMYQFLEQGIIKEYNTETRNGFDMFRGLFKHAWLNKTKPEDTVVHVMTGSGGMELVQKWGQYEDNKLSIFNTEDLNYELTEDAYGQGRKGVILNKKEYRGIYLEPYGKIIFHYLPFLDNTTVTTKRHNGWPIDSYQFIVFDFGLGDVREGSNINIFQNPDFEQFGYGTGGWGPDGGQFGKAPRWPNTLGNENAYELIREMAFGFVIKDVTSLLWAVPDIV